MPKRHLTVLALAFAASGCYISDPGSVPFVVVVDDAVVRPMRWDATPWCLTGSIEKAYVAAGFGAGIQTSPDVDASGLQPSWRAPMINAVAASFNFGTLLDVVGLCPGDPTPLRLGAALVHPDVGVLQRGGVSVRGFGGVEMLRFHFIPAKKYKPPAGGTFAAVPAEPFWPIDVVDQGNGWAADNGEPPWMNDRAPPPPSVPCDCTTTGGGAAGGGAGDPSGGVDTSGGGDPSGGGA